MITIESEDQVELIRDGEEDIQTWKMMSRTKVNGDKVSGCLS